MGRTFDTDDELLRHRLRNLGKEPDRTELEAIAPGLWDAARQAVQTFESENGSCTRLKSLRGLVKALGAESSTSQVVVEAPIPSYRKIPADPTEQELPGR